MLKNKTWFVYPFAFIFLIALVFGFNRQAALAQENPCPPGQEQQNGCKWVQNQRTGRCRWLPPYLVIYPWIEISPVGACPPIGDQPTATNTSAPQPTATNTSAPQPTATNTSIAQPTATGEDGGDPTATGQPPLPTAKPHPPREQPGGPGNLGYLIAGSAAMLALLAGGAFLLRGATRKRS